MPSAYVQFEEKYCTGCTKCVRACPTKSIRIRNQRAVLLEHLCIGCGECIRVCPEGAISPVMSRRGLEKTDKITVAIVSPILYAQFPGVMPCDVLMSLNHMGFDHAIDLSYYLEMYQYAVERFIEQNRERKETPWPLISPICPVVKRLIALKHPGLLDHILPLKRPVALVESGIRREISEQYAVSEDDVLLYHLTPCPSKVTYGDTDDPKDQTGRNPAIGINDIFPRLLEEVEATREMDLNLYPYRHLSFIPNARGPLWAMSGGEIAGMNIDRALAVSGLQEVKKYIEKIEMGLFQDTEYIEFRACPEGCIGGPLTAVDKYLARSTVQKLIKMFGLGRRIQPRKLRRLYDRGWFFSQAKPSDYREEIEDKSRLLTIEDMRRIEYILSQTPGHDCAACGAPDCRTFAEDVVRGYARLTDCYKFALDQCRDSNKSSDKTSE